MPHPHHSRGERLMRGGRFGHLLREHGHPGHRRQGGPARVFDQGDLRWVILKMVADKPSHGYELIKAIEARLGGAYSPSPGVVYPTLTLLEEMGYIAPDGDGGARKAFAITEEGRAALAQNEAAVGALFERMAAAAARAGGGPSPRIIRAMENLRLALRLKLEAGALSEAQIAGIATALDTAANEIERA